MECLVTSEGVAVVANVSVGVEGGQADVVAGGLGVAVEVDAIVAVVPDQGDVIPAVGLEGGDGGVGTMLVTESDSEVRAGKVELDALGEGRFGGVAKKVLWINGEIVALGPE